jgi:type I restriction-modification system DNA methylase subunit
MITYKKFLKQITDLILKTSENIGEKIDNVCRDIENDNRDLDDVLTNTIYNDKRKYPDDKLRQLISHFNSPRLRNEGSKVLEHI